MHYINECPNFDGHTRVCVCLCVHVSMFSDLLYPRQDSINHNSQMFFFSSKEKGPETDDLCFHKETSFISSPLSDR